MIILFWFEKITNTPHQKLFYLFLFLKLLGIAEVKLIKTYSSSGWEWTERRLYCFKIIKLKCIQCRFHCLNNKPVVYKNDNFILI